MLNSLKYLILISFFTLSLDASSHAVIELVSGSATGLGNQTNPFTEGFIEIPGGPGQGFVLQVCTTSTLGTNSFLPPTPDSLTLLDAGNCGEAPIPLGSCVTGIWTDSEIGSNGDDGFCNWTDPTTVYGAGAFRWIGIDRENPIIDIQCNTGFGQIGTSPSIDVEDGSAIVRVFTFGVNFNQNMVGANEIFNGSIYSLNISDNPGNLQAVFLREFASIAEETGPTGDFDVSLPNEIGQPEAQAPWRACTIGLREFTVGPSPIPTLSEWGMGVFVVLTAAASVWALRRRARTA